MEIKDNNIFQGREGTFALSYSKQISSFSSAIQTDTPKTIHPLACNNPSIKV
jgi:hypothetical protein